MKMNFEVEIEIEIEVEVHDHDQVDLLYSIVDLYDTLYYN